MASTPCAPTAVTAPEKQSVADLACASKAGQRPGVAPVRERSTFILLCAVYFVEGADMQLLPSTFRALEAQIGLAPSDLATLGMVQAVAMCATAPFWGILVDAGWSGKGLLVGGSTAWAVLTALLALTTHFWTMLALRFLNGVALATLTPVSQALIARATAPSERGSAFGYCGFAQMLGGVVCAVFATAVANEMVLGHQGWRAAFFVVAFVSLLLAVALAACLRDDRTGTFREPRLLEEAAVFFGYCRTPTFVVIVLQGCAGAAPWSALSFLIMYYQYIGMTDGQAAVLSAVAMLSKAVGSVVGGYTGDALTSWSRFHGRPLTAQISVVAGTVVTLAFFCVVPQRASSFYVYAALMVIFGLTASWCYAGTNRPILLEVVPESSQARVLGWETALEGSSSACLGAPLVGFLASAVFGYVPQHAPMSQIPATVRQNNAQALASGMLWMTILPWSICFIVFSCLHFTYRRDVERIKASDSNESTKLMG